MIVNEMSRPSTGRHLAVARSFAEVPSPRERILGLLREDRGSRQELFSLAGISA